MVKLFGLYKAAEEVVQAAESNSTPAFVALASDTSCEDKSSHRIIALSQNQDLDFTIVGEQTGLYQHLKTLSLLQPLIQILLIMILHTQQPLIRYAAEELSKAQFFM